MGMNVNSTENNLRYKLHKQIKTVNLSIKGVNKMEYELKDMELEGIELKEVKLEEVERDYVEFRREMGEE